MNRTVQQQLLRALAALTFISVSGSAQPRLAVFISYDQMRGDYIERWKNNFSNRGFLRAVNEGQHFTNCYFEHAATLTAPGHSILLTGKHPAKTGIVSNDFYDRTTKRMHYCVDDSVYGLSPRNMKARTLGDLLKEKSPGSKVISLGIKDRAAILMAGHKPDHVVWFDPADAEFVSSPYYQKPRWLDIWNNEQPVNQYSGMEWQKVLPDSGAAKDDVPAEADFPGGGGKTFPHRIPLVTKENFSASRLNEFFEAWASSPFSVENLFSLATYAIQKEDLGSDSLTDILCIGVSTTDWLGHYYGPDSREVEELYVHCDRVLGEFIDYLDATIGRENYLLVVTSDHGVGPIPELHEHGGRRSSRTILAQANLHLEKVFSQKDLIKVFQPPSFFLDDEKIYRKGISFNAVVDTLKQFCLRHLQMAIAATPAEIAGLRCENVNPKLCRMLKNDLYPPRSGDLIVYPPEYVIYGSSAATHGTPYDYDRFVPLIFLGAGLPPAQSELPVSPVDIAPSVGALLGIEVLNADGKRIPLR